VRNVAELIVDMNSEECRVERNKRFKNI